MYYDIDYEQFIAETSVVGALIDAYAKQLIMLEYTSEDVVQECFYQEGEKWDKFKDDLNAGVKGKSGENIIKKILLFIPRLIVSLINLIKNKFKKNIENLRQTVSMVEQIASKIPECQSEEDFIEVLTNAAMGMAVNMASNNGNTVSLDDLDDMSDKSDTKKRTKLKTVKFTQVGDYANTLPKNVNQSADRLFNLAMALREGKICTGIDINEARHYFKTATAALDETDLMFGTFIDKPTKQTGEKLCEIFQKYHGDLTHRGFIVSRPGVWEGSRATTGTTLPINSVKDWLYSLEQTCPDIINRCESINQRISNNNLSEFYENEAKAAREEKPDKNYLADVRYTSAEFFKYLKIMIHAIYENAIDVSQACELLNRDLLIIQRSFDRGDIHEK